MRRRMITTRAVAVAAAVLLFAACGSSSGSSAKDTSTTTKKTTTLPKVTIEAADFSFDVPATIPAGYVDVTVNNTGKEGHQVQFVKLGDGVTYDDFKAAAAKTDISALSTSTFVGGPNGADPGGPRPRSSSSTRGPTRSRASFPAPTGRRTPRTA